MRRPSADSDTARVVAAHLAEWESAQVELACYGSDDASAIGRAIEDFCRRELGAGVAQALFHRSSIGAVTGLRLTDGREVVVRAHQPEWSRVRLREIVALQRRIDFAPPVVAGPLPLGCGFAVVERYVDRGTSADGHDPEIRRALAVTLHGIVDALAPFVVASPLPAQIVCPPADGLWPRPHSRLFDFEATRAGAEHIDAVASEARGRMTPAGRVVLGHGDWRVEHVRFDGARVVVAYDWDGLSREPEPALVGATAHAFCADWDRANYAPAPTLEEAGAFVADYEAARGRRFGDDERRLCDAAFAYAVAYTARCEHALGDHRLGPGTFRHLLAGAGRRLLALTSS